MRKRNWSLEWSEFFIAHRSDGALAKCFFFFKTLVTSEEERNVQLEYFSFIFSERQWKHLTSRKNA